MSQKFLDMIKRQAELGSTPSPNLPDPAAVAFNPSIPLATAGTSNASFMPIPNSQSAMSSAGQVHTPQAVLPSMTTAHAVLSHVSNVPAPNAGHFPPPLEVSRSNNSLYVSPPNSMPSSTSAAGCHDSSFSPPTSTHGTAGNGAMNYYAPDIIEVDDITRIKNLFRELLSTKGNYQIDDNVYEVIKHYTEALAQSILEGAAAIARNRGDKTVDKADILLLLAKKLGIELPGEEIAQPLHHHALKSTSRSHQDLAVKKPPPKKK